MAYTWDEIEKARHDAGVPDLNRAHEIFAELKAKAQKGTSLNIAETFHFCDFESIGTRKGLSGYDIHSFDICEDFWFMDAFREYWSDLHGIYTHKDLFTQKSYSKIRIKSDTVRLSSLAADWQEAIDKTNHSEKILKEVTAETRKEIKSYDNDPTFHEFGCLRKCNNYKFGLKRLQLRSKYIYLFTREFFDRQGSESVELRLGSKIVEFTTYSMIHVLNRHYYFSQKQTDKDKSLHSEIVQPRDIHVVLGHVFSLLSDEDLKRLDNDRIHFDYKGELFTVWINSATKQVKGKGNVRYERVASFYPVKNISEKQKIHTNYNKEKRDADVQVYFKP